MNTIKKLASEKPSSFGKLTPPVFGWWLLLLYVFEPFNLEDVIKVFLLYKQNYSGLYLDERALKTIKKHFKRSQKLMLVLSSSYALSTKAHFRIRFQNKRLWRFEVSTSRSRRPEYGEFWWSPKGLAKRLYWPEDFPPILSRLPDQVQAPL